MAATSTRQLTLLSGVKDGPSTNVGGDYVMPLSRPLDVQGRALAIYSVMYPLDYDPPSQWR